MSRQLRPDYDGAWHHVMHRGLRKQAIFHNDEDRRYFLTLLGDILDRYGVETHAFVLMSDHYHLVVHTPNAGLSAAMRHLNGVYTQYFNRVHGTDGPLFRGRFKSITIDSDEYLTTLVRYTHLNPVAAKLSPRPHDYPWSSHRAYLGLCLTPPFLYCDTVLGYFDGDRKRFASFVEGPDTAKNRDLRAAIDEGRPALGGERHLRAVVMHSTLDRETAASASRLRSSPSLEALECFVADSYRTSTQAVTHHSKSARNDAHAVLLTLAHRAGVATLSELAERYGYSNYGSVSASIHRLEARAAHDAQLRDVLGTWLIAWRAA